MLCAVVLFSFAAIGCSGWFAFTPERVVLQESFSRADNKFSGIDRSSIRVLRQESWNNEFFVLSYFRETSGNNEESDCLMLSRIRKERSGWTTPLVNQVCNSPGINREPIRQVENLEGWQDNEEVTVLFGLMQDGESVAIEFEWEDGKAERADLVNGSYLVLREGAHRLDFFRGIKE